MNRIDGPLEISRLNQKHLENKKKLQESQEQEINTLKKQHDLRKLSIKSKNAENIHGVRVEHDQNLRNTVENHTNKLQQASKDLKEREENLKQIETSIGIQHENHIKNQENQFKDKMRGKTKESTKALETLNQNAKESNKKIKTQLEDAVWNTRNRAANTIADLTLKTEDLIFDKRMKLDKRMQQQDQNFRNLIAKQEIEHGKRIKEMKKKHFDMISTLQKKHKQEFLREQTVLNQQLQQGKKRLQNNLEAMKLQNQKALETMKTLTEASLQGSKQSSEKSKQQYIERAQDNFYNLTALNPVLKSFPTHYEVNIDVPEHEKDMVNLNAFKRELRVSLARRYEDKRVGQDGSEVSTHRNEVLSRTLNVPDIVNPEEISRSYAGKTLTFTIEKM